jgi:predicted adenylyl cyclase CyaB
MERNVEIKARIESIDSILPVVAALAERAPSEIFQDDTFFSCPHGRLKLRVFSETDGELIFYRRPDIAGPKESSYIVSPNHSPGTLREALSLAFGQVGRVRKHRRVFLIGRTRIHLDRVEGLGEFLEIEVVLSENEPVEAGISIAQELLGKLGVSSRQLVKQAYVDLLERRKATRDSMPAD